MLGVRHHDIQDVGGLGGQHALDRRHNLGFLRDVFAGHLEGFAHFDVVGVDVPWCIKLAEEGMGAVGLVFQILPLHDHAEMLIVQNDALDGNALGHRSGEFLNVHQYGAVAVDIHDLKIGEGDFAPERGWQAVSHGSKAQAADKTPGFVEVIILGGPHLVLTHAGGHDDVAFAHFVKFLNHELGSNRIGVIFVGVGAVFFPLGDLFQPFGALRELPGIALVARHFQHLVEAFEGLFDVGLDGEFDVLVLVNFCVVDVYMDDRAMLAELLHLAGHAVIEADAEGEQEISFIGRVVGGHGSVHAQPFQREWMRFWEGTHAHQRRCHRNVGAFGEFEQFLMGFARNDPAAAVQYRTLSLLDQPDGLIHRHFVQFKIGLVPAKLDRVRINRLAPGLLDVFRHVNNHRPGPTRLRDVKGLFDDARNVVGIRHQIAVLDDRQGHSKKVRFLKGTPSDHERGHLTGDHHQRRGVQIGIGNRRHNVCRPRSGGPHAHACSSGYPGIPFRCKSTALLMAGQNGANLLRSGQGLVDRHRCPARIGENRIDPLALHAAHKDFSPRHHLSAIRRGGGVFWGSGSFGGHGLNFGNFGKGKRSFPGKRTDTLNAPWESANEFPAGTFGSFGMRRIEDNHWTITRKTRMSSQAARF